MNFKFSNFKKSKPKRVVILGSSGIISINLQEEMKKRSVNTLTIGRSTINLKSHNASKLLTRKIKNGDTIVFIAAEAPVKNFKMLINNLKICNNVCNSLQNKKIFHLVYISSDAVYADIKEKITENSKTMPLSLHGLMHLTRESILRSKFNKILCILRPTLIYGMGDSHNGYGPNRFIKCVLKKKPIKIFGKGEERRDHIFVDDLTKIIVNCIEQRGLGILNLASGRVFSFKYLAKLIINLSKTRSKLIRVKRQGPMPHNGYRPFNIKKLKNYFRDIKISPVKFGLIKYLESASKQ